MTLAERGEKGVSPGVVAHLLTWGVLIVTALFAGVPGAEVISVDSDEKPLSPVVVDFNSDPWPRLMLVEGIGEVLAQRIVDSRDALGGFRCLEDVMALEGIPDPPLLRAREWLLPKPCLEQPPKQGGSQSRW